MTKTHFDVLASGNELRDSRSSSGNRRVAAHSDSAQAASRSETLETELDRQTGETGSADEPTSAKLS